MRALFLVVLAGLSGLPGPARAVVRGEVVRDPAGIRQSVVRIESSKGELCSGALIGPDLVLTAAHCLTEQATYRVVAVNRSFKPLTLKAIAAAIHPEFVPGTTPRTQPGVDLAILKLERSLGADFAPLDLANTPRIGTGENVLLAGFGVVAEGQKGSARILRRTTLVSLGPLQVMNRVVVVADGERMAETAGAGACRGDSGGPILAATGTGLQLLGVVSWSSGAVATRESTACGGLTAVTPVSDHVSWIIEGSAALNKFSEDIPAIGRRVPDGQWMRKRR
jgi:secreted trypsin-like serine protease